MKDALIGISAILIVAAIMGALFFRTIVPAGVGGLQPATTSPPSSHKEARQPARRDARHPRTVRAAEKRPAPGPTSAAEHFFAEYQANPEGFRCVGMELFRIKRSPGSPTVIESVMVGGSKVECVSSDNPRRRR